MTEVRQSFAAPWSRCEASAALRPTRVNRRSTEITSPTQITLRTPSVFARGSKTIIQRQFHPGRVSAA
ncbi:hypothetical protein [Rhodopila sp.]|uniref:hypothetical protein n=1 Tax=Rhodopila sp. TaxID=2480087 RepID=UPI003D10F3B9